MIPALTALAWIATGAAGLALAMSGLNLLTWPRGTRTATFPGTVSVCIPARNEEATIGACVDAVLAQRHPLLEVVVYDDGSTDATPDLLAERAARDPRLRVVQGQGLPEGWVGKPHACHQLARHARGDLLLFVDADVTLDPDAVGRVASLLAHHEAEVLTAVPGQDTGSLVERLVLPLLHLTYTAWLPLFLVHTTHDPRFLAANGQILAVRRHTYDALGGFEAVRTEVVDDMAFCRRAKRARRRVVFADGSTLARCRMYTSAREVWEGFSKNLYEGLGESPLMLGLVVMLYSLAFIVPYLLLAASPLVPALLLPAAIGVGLNLAVRGALALRFGHPLDGVLLHPVAVAVLLAIAFNSWRWAASGTIRWAGRTYAAKARRGTS
jgi:chlorobactene glucosyltransferase